MSQPIETLSAAQKLVAQAGIGAVSLTASETIAGTKTYTGKAFFNGPFSSDSPVQIGTVECQGFSLNNAWIGENVFFNGSNFQRRQTGAAGLFYFFGKEGQLRFDASAAAGNTTGSNIAQLKVNAAGIVAIGGAISPVVDDFTGALLVVSSTGVKANTALQVQSAVPATATSAGVAGTITYAAGFVYVCVATNVWQRAALITF